MDAINLKVLDLSHYNCGPSGEDDDPIDFGALYAFGIRGIIHKASQGVGNVDHRYAERRSAAIAVGMLWGAYHFATGDDADAQVKHFLECAQPDANTLMALDHEPNEGNELDAPGARAFCESLRDQLGGRLPKLYSGNLIKEQAPKLSGDDRAFFANVPWWLCEYGPDERLVDMDNHPMSWTQVWLWQFAGDGIDNRGIAVPGIYEGHKVDMNSFTGSDADLAASWA
jgi:lysozyme